MRGKQKDKIYHSTLTKTPEGIKLRFMSDTMDSKFADSGGYVFVETEDGTDAMFILENADIRSAVDAVPQKKWVTIRGEGKGDGACIVFDDEVGPVLPGKPPARQQAPQTAPVNEWSKLVTDATDIALIAYGRLETGGHPLDSAGKASVFSTIFIAMDRRA